jgi:hypothetical protein
MHLIGDSENYGDYVYVPPPVTTPDGVNMDDINDDFLDIISGGPNTEPGEMTVEEMYEETFGVPPGGNPSTDLYYDDNDDDKPADTPKKPKSIFEMLMPFLIFGGIGLGGGDMASMPLMMIMMMISQGGSLFGNQ